MQAAGGLEELGGPAPLGEGGDAGDRGAAGCRLGAFGHDGQQVLQSCARPVAVLWQHTGQGFGQHRVHGRRGAGLGGDAESLRDSLQLEPVEGDQLPDVPAQADGVEFAAAGEDQQRVGRRDPLCCGGGPRPVGKGQVHGWARGPVGFGDGGKVDGGALAVVPFGPVGDCRQGPGDGQFAVAGHDGEPLREYPEPGLRDWPETAVVPAGLVSGRQGAERFWEFRQPVRRIRDGHADHGRFERASLKPRRPGFTPGLALVSPVLQRGFHLRVQVPALGIPSGKFGVVRQFEREQDGPLADGRREASRRDPRRDAAAFRRPEVRRGLGRELGVGPQAQQRLVEVGGACADSEPLVLSEPVQQIAQVEGA